MHSFITNGEDISRLQLANTGRDTEFVKKQRHPTLQRIWPTVTCSTVKLKVKVKLKTNLYSAIKSKDSEALDGGTSQLSSQREYGEIKMF